MGLVKTRDISVQDLYTLLQLEFISYKVREKIYHRPYDKKKFNDICEKKKEKILGLSLKNSLPSIFGDDNKYKEKYINKFLNGFGLPKFQYSNDHNRKVYGKWDKVYWFADGVSVKVDLGENDCSLGEIINYDSRYNQVSVILEDERMLEVPIDLVGRIITKDFFNF